MKKRIAFYLVFMIIIAILPGCIVVNVKPAPTPEPTIGLPTETAAPSSTYTEPELSAEVQTDEPQPTPTQQNSAGADEVPLVSLAKGSWFSISANFEDGKPDTADYTIYIKDESTGSFHLFDYLNGIKLDYEFNYELVNGVLIFNLENGSELRYDAYQYYNSIHLISQEDGMSISLLNWEDISGVTPSDSYMTALGDWIYYDTSNSTSIIIALSGNEGSMMYNVFGYGANEECGWVFSNGTLEFPYNQAYTDYKLKIDHRGNVLFTIDENAQQKIFNRVTANVMGGYYVLDSTSEPDLDTWEMRLDTDGYSSHDITADGSSFYQESISWFVNYIDGTLNIMLNGDQHVYYYHFYETGLLLFEPIEQYYYEFYKLD